jgi:superfamily II DNA or RNA helicase
MAQPIALLPHQVEHVQKIRDILKKSPFAIDLSELGSGKTFASSKLAVESKNSRIIVVCPKSVSPVWMNMQQQYGVPIKHVITFSSLSAKKNKQPKCGLISRLDFKKEHPKNKNQLVDAIEYTATNQMIQMVNQGVFVIIDEIQNMKNESARFLAVRALIKPIIEKFDKDATSRVILMSGSPIDRWPQAVRLLRTLDIMKSDSLTIYKRKGRDEERTYPGMDEIVQFCRKLAPEKVSAPKGDNAACVEQAAQLFKTVILDHLSSTMSAPKLPFELKKYDGFFEIHSAKERDRILENMGELANTIKYKHDTGMVTFEKNAVCQITKYMREIEDAKVSTIARATKDHLSRNPKAHIIVAVNFNRTLNKLKRVLEDYNPMVIRGSHSIEKRTRVVKKFQENSTSRRLILANLKVCSTGISLDDQHGDFPRTILVSPTYNTIDLYQLGHRVMRSLTKSSASVYMIYAKITSESDKDTPVMAEDRIMEALMRKGKTMADVTPLQVDNGVVFPGAYSKFMEVDTDFEDQTTKQILETASNLEVCDDSESDTDVSSDEEDEDYESVIGKKRKFTCVDDGEVANV